MRGLPGWLLSVLLWAGCAPASSPDVASAPPAASVARVAAASPASDRASSVTVAPASHAGAAHEGLARPASEAAAGIATAARESGLQDVSFEDIQLPIQADMVLRPFMLTQRVKDLDGKKIRISGYMLPDVKTKDITEFVLLKNTQCKFGPGGQADHLINVLMVDGAKAKFRADAISVEGVLKINPFQGPDGNTWSIYDLACERVEVYRPRR